MDDNPSLFNSHYPGRNGETQDNITKQKTTSQISRGWDNIFWTLILDWTIDLLELDAFSSRE